MSTATHNKPTTQHPGVGEPLQLGAYTIGTEERVLYGQRIDGVVRVSDHPANGQPGRRYVIERGLEQDGYGALQALVADYIAQAVKHQAIPVISAPLERYLAMVSE